MSPNPPPAAELLAAHSVSLRALARHLVGDPHAAEDVVQDTWVRALERPPARMDTLGAWLRTVLRNVVANRRRGEARRTSREAVVARPEAQADASDTRARTLRAVVDAVLALDEPYRGTVLARYFEDLPPSEIAQREGVSVHTIESRLRRALARLRERLSRELTDEVGGARHGLLLLAGLRPDGAGLALGSATATGAVVVGTKAKVLIGGAAAALAAWLLWIAWPEPAEPVAAVAPQAGGVVTRTPVLPEPGQEPVAEAEPEPPASPQAAPVPPPPSRTIELSVLVTTDEGLPLRAAAILAAPDRHALNDVATTGPDGQAEVRIPVRVPRLDLVVAAWHPEHGLAGPWRFEANTRDTTEVTLSLDPSALPSLEAQVAVEEEAFEAILKRRWSQPTGQASLLAIVTAPAAGRRDAGEVQLVREGWLHALRARWVLEAEGEVRSGPIEVLSGPILAWGSFGAGSELADFMGEAFVAFARTPPTPSAGVRLTGSVLGPHGLAVEGALVTAGLEADPHAWRARSDDLGAFLIDGLPAGELVVNAFAAGSGQASQRFHAVPGQVLTWDSRLKAGRTYEGQLLPRGGPLPSPLRLEWAAAGRGRLDVRGVDPDEENLFALARLSRDRAALVAMGPQTSLPWVVDPKVSAKSSVQALLVQARDMQTGELRLRVLDPATAGRSLGTDQYAHLLSGYGGLEVRVWMHGKLPAERGTWMDRGGAPGEYALVGVPPGRYLVEVGSSSRGWVVLDPVVLEPGETLELGQVLLPASGCVRVERRARARRELWLVRRDQVETLIEVLEARKSVTRFLAPGEYLLFDPDDRSRGFAFTLEAGEKVVVSDEGVIDREPLR